MAKTARKVVVVMGMVAVGLAGAKPAASGAEPEFSAMRILVITVAGVPPPDMLVRAQAETARIYAAVGVRLVWEAANPMSSLSRLSMLIISNPDAWPARVAADALGAAPAAENGKGRLAYAFHERIEASAQKHGTDPAKILGHVMAHELGHILLARGAHSPTGIMSDRWGSFQMELIAISSMRFTKVQAELIRSTVVQMNLPSTEVRRYR